MTLDGSEGRVPDEDSPLEVWKEWLKGHRDVLVESRVILALVKGLADAREHNAVIQKAWDEERNRL